MNARFLLILGAGLLFGFGLAISGMCDPGRVTGFLDITGAWDPALAFVMGGAVATFGVSLAVWRKFKGGAGWFGTRLPKRDHDPVDRRLVLGALIFGIGWGLAGFCPGPALANLSLLRIEALVFVPTMAAGMLLAHRFFRAN